MYLLISYVIQLFTKFQKKQTSLKLSVSLLFYPPLRAVKEESSEHPGLDGNHLNLQNTEHVKKKEKTSRQSQNM